MVYNGVAGSGGGGETGKQRWGTDSKFNLNVGSAEVRGKTQIDC